VETEEVTHPPAKALLVFEARSCCVEGKVKMDADCVEGGDAKLAGVKCCADCIR
jgi:hypothetical protein